MTEDTIKALEYEDVAKSLVADTRIALATVIMQGPDPSRSPNFPFIADFLAFGPLKDIFSLPLWIIISEKHLMPVVEAFRQQWTEKTPNQLILALVGSQSKQLRTKDRKRVYVQLACNAFVCRGCSSPGLFFPQVLEYECYIYSLDPQTVGHPELEQRRVWTAKYLSRHETLMSDVPTFLRAIKLDPATATVEGIVLLKQFYHYLICHEAHPFDGSSKNIYMRHSFIEHIDKNFSGVGSAISYPENFENIPSESTE
ncbi:hypothetical protein EV421DRAFT_2022595 [Armillaria borealis]|uniref:Uncharacterized protein n=1 Tax=Armillaria borealis TaxID=47425 RepID=A0AA39J6P7_9AGAR|nr:hypothetical protein EV421DRAFT_2022595 [Armillaria borealis]